VVLKLFNVVQPDRAYFGEKDIQQLAVIRRMTRDLNIPVTVVGVPTVRETDGLALSSRNQYLTPEQRTAAPNLYRALQEAARVIREGQKDPLEVRQAALKVLHREMAIQIEYFEIVDPEEMQPVNTINGPVRVAAAVWLGSTRLIDNVSA
jgi:pantoate--beta-alanine ligase